MNDIDARIRAAKVRVSVARTALEEARDEHAEAVDELETLEYEKEEERE